MGDRVNITIIAQSFYSATTSFGSGGLWKPAYIAGTDEKEINKWGQVAFNHFVKLYNSADCARAGVRLVTSYNLRQAHETVLVPAWKDIVFNFQMLDKELIQAMGFSDRFTQGFKFGTMIVEQRLYMKYLTEILET